MRNITQSGEIYNEQINLIQVNKTTALKLFLNNERIFIQSCNIMPIGMWQNAYEIKKDAKELEFKKEMIKFHEKHKFNYPGYLKPEAATYKNQFKNICDNYSYYNLDNERGLYISYYKVG